MNAYIGIGGNVGTPAELRERFGAAGQRLKQLPYVLYINWSPLYLSRPAGPVAGQPDYLNGVLELGLLDAASPGRLLEDLLQIEAQHGRDRTLEVPQGPRTLDLDLLLYDDLVLHERSPLELVVPHPRLHERAFALVPLAELAGDDLVIPGLGVTIAGCLSAPSLRDQASGLVLVPTD